MDKMSLPKTKKMVHLWKSDHFWRNGCNFTDFVTSSYQYNGRFYDPRGCLYGICLTGIPVDILTTFGVWICPILPCIPMHPNTLNDVMGSDMTPRPMLGSKTWLFFGPVIRVKQILACYFKFSRQVTCIGDTMSLLDTWIMITHVTWTCGKVFHFLLIQLSNSQMVSIIRLVPCTSTFILTGTAIYSRVSPSIDYFHLALSGIKSYWLFDSVYQNSCQKP